MTGISDASVPWDYLAAYTFRANRLLSDRDPEQIYWGGVAVHWMLDRLVPQMERVNQMHRPPVVVLSENRSLVSIAAMDYFPDATWEALFAAHALDHLGQAHTVMQIKRERSDSGTASELSEEMDHKFFVKVVKATEAVCVAERIASEAAVMLDHQRRLLSERQRDLAVKRHAPVKEICERFVTYYFTCDHTNKSKAARDFLRDLTPELRSRLTYENENAKQTLLRHLRRHNRPTPKSS